MQESPRFLPDPFVMNGIYATPPAIDVGAWREYLSREFGPTDVIGDGEPPVFFAFTEHRFDYKDRSGVPAQAFLAASKDFSDLAKYETALQQSWDFPDIKDVLSRGRHFLATFEFLARALAFEDRLRLFRALTSALVELTDPIALYSSTADAFFEPRRWLEVQREGYTYYGFFNVRFFRISNSDDDSLMDTRGLGIFGVPDLQCHFRGLDPDEVSRLLYNTGVYLMREGDVIEDGHTVPGIQEGSRWHCQHEEALIGPEREVLDICPEAPYAAGNRNP